MFCDFPKYKHLKQTIYRGPGGTGEARTDSDVTEVRIIADEAEGYKDQAATSASAAASSASAAATAETNAETAESNAETAEVNAEAAQAAAEAAQAAAEAAQTAAEAAQTAAELAETNAETAEANAETAEANAETAQAAAATSATNAAASASTATTQASNAASSASTATTQAGIATTKASEAASSATAAQSAQTAAESARDSALSAYDNFDDRYLGPKSSDPTLDNDGNALLTGALYYDTTSSVMKVYTGSSWVAAYVSAAGVLLAANNLSDLVSVSTARTNLGLGTAATTASTAYATAAQGTNADTAYGWGNHASAGYAADSAVVKLTGNQTVGGTKTFSSTITGSISGNAGTVTNGVYTTGSYADPSWITSLAGSKVSGNISGNAATATTATNLSGGTVSATSISDSGNLTFTGTGNRITGDMSNATVSNRVAFQTSTTNSATRLLAIPNGTATVSALALTNNSDPNNASWMQVSSETAECRVNATFSGTGSFLPMTFYTGGSERMRVDTSGNVGIGTSSPGEKLRVTSTGTNEIRTHSSSSGDARVGFWAEGSVYNYIQAVRSNGALGYFADLQTFNNGSGTERMRIDSSGNVGIGTSSPTANIPLTILANSSNAIAQNIRGRSDGIGVLRFADNADTENGRVDFRTDYAAISVVRAAPLVFSTNNAERMRIDSSGNLLVGKTAANTSPGLILYSPSSTSNVGRIDFTKSASGSFVACNFAFNATTVGSIYTDNVSTAYVTSSDYRLKEDVQPMIGALAKVAALKPCTYKWKADGSDGEGFIAHELAEVVPQCVTGEKDAVDADGNPQYQGIDTSFLVATLTAAIQEQQAIITALTARVEALESN